MSCDFELGTVVKTRPSVQYGANLFFDWLLFSRTCSYCKNAVMLINNASECALKSGKPMPTVEIICIVLQCKWFLPFHVASVIYVAIYWTGSSRRGHSSVEPFNIAVLNGWILAPCDSFSIWYWWTSHDHVSTSQWHSSVVGHMTTNKKLCYCRGTTRRAMLVNSCYVSRGMGVRKASNSKSDLQGHWRVSTIVPFSRPHTISC